MSRAGAIRAGRAEVEIGLRDRLQAGLRRAEARLNAFRAGVNAAGLRTLALGTAITAPFAVAARHFARAGDALDKMSKRTGVSVEALSELGYAAEIGGANIETLEKGVRTMQRSINDLGRGLSTQVDAFKALNLTVEDLRGLSPEEQFLLIADRLSMVTDATTRAALAQQIFGRAGTQLLPMMADGAAGIAKLTEEARRFGLTISTQTAEAAAKLTDEMTLLRRVVQVLGVEIGGALAPALSRIVTTLTPILVGVRAWAAENRALVAGVAAAGVVVIGLGGALVSLGFSLGILSFSLKSIIGLLVLVKTGMALVAGALASPLLLVGALGAAVVLLVARVVGGMDAGGAAVDRFKARFGELFGEAMRVVRGVARALSGGEIELAGEVAMAGLHVAWLRGTQSLRDLWGSFSVGVAKTGLTAFSHVRKGWIHVRDWFERNFPEFTASFAKAFATVSTFAQSQFRRMAAGLSVAWAKVLSMLDDSVDFEATRDLILDDLNRDLDAIEERRKKAFQEADRRKNRSESERLEELARALADAERELQEALDAVDDKSADRIKKAEEELEKARQRLKDALEEAEGLDVDGSAASRSGAGGEDEESPLAGALDGLRDTVRGIFGGANALALQSGPSRLQERTAKAAERTAENTREIARALRDATGLTFA